MSSVYSVVPDYSSVPAGSYFQLAQQKAIFSDPIFSGHNNLVGQNCKVVAEGPNGENCLQWYFPPGVVGVNPGRGAAFGLYQADVNVPACDQLDVEYEVMFKPGFDINNTTFGTNMTNRMGKIGPAIRLSGITNRLEWYSNGGPAHTKFCGFMEVEDQTQEIPPNSWPTGSTKSAFTTWDIPTGVWIKVHLQTKGGPNGWEKIWVQRPTDPSEVLLMNFGPTFNSAASTPRLEMGPYFGGFGPYVAPTVDSYMNTKITRIYTPDAALPIPSLIFVQQ